MSGANIHQLLKQYWGFDQFRPLQEDIIRSVLEINDTLALLPTGGGKSLCFQVPALARDGLCLVISPLIALMKDQVINLQKRGIKATAIFTGMSPKEIDFTLEQCAAGKYKFLYISPERLTTRIFLARIERLQIGLLAIDEAHCISQWGHDFRPEYRRIAEIRPFLKNVPVIALTATATPQVVKDIMEQLGMPNGKLFQKSFQRSNLAYRVLHDEDKIGQLLRLIKSTEGSAVVYANSRKKTQLLADLLVKNGVSASFYHAGLTATERDKRQHAWIVNQIRVIVCTNAFGMGIDKPDVRLVVHTELPDNLEAYFQEAGRAGRDEKAAACYLIYHPSDRQELLRLFEMSFPPLVFIRNVYKALGNYYQLAIGSGKYSSFTFELTHFCEQFNFKAYEAYQALKFIHQAGYIQLNEAAFAPAKLRFIQDAVNIYDFRLRHKDLDPFIDLLLRSYSGIMEQYVKIDCYQLARKLFLKDEQLKLLLERLQKFELVDYVPQTDKPMLTFLEERIAEEQLILPDNQYAALKKERRQKLEAALHYAASTDSCRSNLLLEYFGEKPTQLCGQCDYCLGWQQDVLNDAIIRLLQPKIIAALDTRKTIEALANSIEFEPKKLLIECIRWMIDQNIIVCDADEKLSLKA